MPSGENGCGTGAERPLLVWLGVRVADGASLENWKSETVRGFESHPSRQKETPMNFVLFFSILLVVVIVLFCVAIAVACVQVAAFDKDEYYRPKKSEENQKENKG